jgi:GNAT superfamily N-acetyltransferase
MTSERTDTTATTDHRNEFTIRTARRKDIPDFTRLNAQLGYPESMEIIGLRYRRIVRDRRNHQLFVAVAAGSAQNAACEVIGWIHVLSDKLLTVGPRAEIGGLVVDELWRSRGVGAALLDKAERWALQSRLTRVVVGTNVLRTRAHTFYERCGYQLLKQSRVYTKEIC